MDDFVSNKLNEWGLSHLIQAFKSQNIDQFVFDNLSDSDISSLINSIGDFRKFSILYNNYKLSKNNPDPDIPVLKKSPDSQDPTINVVYEMNAPMIIEDAEVIYEQQDLQSISAVTSRKLNFVQEKEYLARLLSTPTKDIIESDIREIAALKLNDKQKTFRNNIAHIILDKVLDVDPSFKIPRELFAKWATELSVIVPTDLPQVYYFESSVNEKGQPSSAGGILYNTWINKRKKLKKAGIIINAKSKRLTEQEITPVSPDIQEDITWLRNCTDPFEDVITKWKHTHKYRLSAFRTISISSYLQKFLFLRGPQGYSLIEIDFNEIHKERSNHFLSKWPKISLKIIALAKKRFDSNFNVLELLKKHVKNQDIDNSEVIALLLLPFFLGARNLKRNSKGHLQRSSSAESQHHFILHVESNDLIDDELKLRQKQLKNLGESNQPFVVLVGTLTRFSSCQVRIEDTTYILPTATKAVDVCFKSFTALDAKYPEFCKCLWSFIELHIFEIEKKHNKFISVTKFISELNATVT